MKLLNWNSLKRPKTCHGGSGSSRELEVKEKVVTR